MFNCLIWSLLNLTCKTFGVWEIDTWSSNWSGFQPSNIKKLLDWNQFTHNRKFETNTKEIKVLASLGVWVSWSVSVGWRWQEIYFFAWCLSCLCATPECVFNKSQGAFCPRSELHWGGSMTSGPIGGWHSPAELCDWSSRGGKYKVAFVTRAAVSN